MERRGTKITGESHEVKGATRLGGRSESKHQTKAGTGLPSSRRAGATQHRNPEDGKSEEEEQKKYITGSPPPVGFPSVDCLDLPCATVTFHGA
jgi:hypothetical protein